MNNKMNTRFNLNVFYKVSKTVLDQYGWVVIVLPVAFYAIDKVRDLSSEAMDKGYNLTINFKDGNLSLTRASSAS